MFMSRRHFMLGSAGFAVAAARTGIAWPMQSPPVAGGPRWQPSPDLLRNLPRLLELASVPGLALAVVDGGRVWTRGFGEAVEEARQSVSDQTEFEAASLGKPVFAYAVLRLVDARILDLDRPLFDYLPTPEANNARMRRVTPRHVLSHTTGLPN